MNFQIISDSSCDLLPEYTKPNQVEIVPFYVSFDHKTYLKERIEVNHDEFYRKMAEEHVIPKSSLPSVQDYIDAFTPFVRQNIPIICICITTKFSGSYNSATTARDYICENYSDAKIAVIDSTLNTVTQGLYVNEAVRMRNADFSFEQCVQRLEEIKSTGRIFFTVGSLEYLVQNGRIGKVATIAGDKLGIKPLIIMSEGEISLGGITRSRKKAKKNIPVMIEKYFKDNHLSYDDYVFTVGTGFAYEEAEEFQQELEDYLNIKCSTEIKAVIGACVGCHTGPYPLGVGLIQKYDTKALA